MSPVLCEVYHQQSSPFMFNVDTFLQFAVCFSLFATNLEIDSKEQDFVRASQLRCYQTVNTFDCCIWRKCFCFFYGNTITATPYFVKNRLCVNLWSI